MKKDTVSKVKFKRLQRHLKLPLWQTIGLLESLWHCALTNAPDGDIGRLSNDDIAAAIEWEDDADNLVNALVQCGWLDADDEFRLIVHDWSQHVPTYLKGAYDKHNKPFADVAAKQRAKQVKEQPAKQPAKHCASDSAGECASYPSPSHAIPSESILVGASDDAPAETKPKRVRPEEVPLPPELNTAAFIAARDRWFAQRRHKRLSLREDFLKGQYAELAKLGIANAIECVSYTTTQDYHGLLFDRFKGKQKTLSAIYDANDPRAKDDPTYGRM